MSNPTTPIELNIQELEDAIHAATQRKRPLPDQWLLNVKQRLSDVASTFIDSTLGKHAETYDAIRESDVALQPQIEKMSRTDHEIIAEIQAIERDIRELPAGRTLTDHEIAEIADRINPLIAHVRQHQSDVRHWMNESVLRDRGFPSS